MLMRRWTPPSQLPTVTLENTSTVQRTCLRWCKVFISALIATTLITFCIVYTLQKEDFFNRNYQRQQRDEHERQERLLFNTYIQDISNAVLQNSDEKYLSHVRTQTLMILRHLAVDRKKEIILFLYERNLLKNPGLNLYGADLNNVQFTCAQDFHHLHLLGVQWSNAILINCHLTSANFKQSSFLNARFVNCTFVNTSFIGTNLARSQFIQTSIRHVNFTDASLIHANFLAADLVQENDFTNADLYQANLTEEQLQGGIFPITKHNFYHARYPGGSFDSIRSDENLVVNGNAEIECFAEKQTIWQTVNTSMTLSTEVVIDNVTDNDNQWGNCSFVIPTEIRAYQNINLHSYSLLIDTNSAAFSFIAFANCNRSLFQIHMYRSDGFFHELKTYSKPMDDVTVHTNKTMNRYGESSHPFPIYTRRVEVYFGVNGLKTNMTCYFDNLTLTIHQRRSE